MNPEDPTQSTNQPVNNSTTPQPPAPEPVPEILPTAASTESPPINQSTNEPINFPPPSIMHEIPKKKSGFVIFLVVLLILVSLGSLGYWVYQKYFIKQPVVAVESPTPVPTAIADPTAGWKTFNEPSSNLTFKYPSNLGVSPVTSDFTSLKATPEYFVGVTGSDVIYLSLFLYKSNKSPSDWWTTEGKNKFEKLRSEVENTMIPKATVNFTYDVQPTTFAGQNALNITINSDYGSPQTPLKRFLTIIQQNGYIIMTSYQDMGTTQPSIEISNQILSTFKFISPSASPLASPIACTQEAKLCPNGSYVSRTGPKCEFAPCPTP